MSEDENYAPSVTVTAGRIIASLWVAVWIVVAFRSGGLILAWRAMMVFSFPLGFIWAPEWLARIAGAAPKNSLSPDVPVTPQIVRWVGWFVVVGVPAGWLILAHAAKVAN
jgi:hypothetical protein